MRLLILSTLIGFAAVDLPAHAENPKPIAVLEGAYGPVRFSPDRRVLATLGEKGILLWETTTWKVRATLKVDEPIPAEVVFSPDGKLLAAASGIDEASPVVKVWDLSTGRERWSLKPKDKKLKIPVAFSRDGKRLALADLSDDDAPVVRVNDGFRMKGAVRRWDISADKELRMPVAKDAPSAKLVLTPFGNRLLSEKLDIDLGHLASGKWSVSVWVDLQDMNRTTDRGQWRASVDRVYNGKFLNKLFGGTAARSVRLLDRSTGKVALLKHRSPVARLAFSPDGSLLAVADKGGRLRLWETASKDYFVWMTGLGEPDHVAFSPDGRFLLCGGSIRTKWQTDGEAQDTLKLRVWYVPALLRQKGLE